MRASPWGLPRGRRGSALGRSVRSLKSWAGGVAVRPRRRPGRGGLRRLVFHRSSEGRGGHARSSRGGGRPRRRRLRSGQRSGLIRPFRWFEPMRAGGFRSGGSNRMASPDSSPSAVTPRPPSTAGTESEGKPGDEACRHHARAVIGRDRGGEAAEPAEDHEPERRTPCAPVRVHAHGLEPSARCSHRCSHVVTNTFPCSKGQDGTGTGAKRKAPQSAGLSQCAQGDSNSHPVYTGQGPQPCASTNSATGAWSAQYRTGAPVAQGALDAVRAPR
jgi:hypothetical protein